MGKPSPRMMEKIGNEKATKISNSGVSTNPFNHTTYTAYISNIMVDTSDNYHCLSNSICLLVRF